MRKLILATLAAATLATSGLVLAQPADAMVRRCWWTGPVQHCVVHPGWWYHHRYWHERWW